MLVRRQVWKPVLRLWCWPGWCLDDGHGLGPFGGDGVPMLHGETGIMDEHLLAFAPAPGEEAQEMFFADVLSAGGRIDPRLAALDHTGQIVHDGDSR